MSAEHPVPQEAVETNEQERKEKFQSSLAELKKFDEMLYPGVVAFVDSLGDRTQLSPEEQQQAKALMDSVLNLNILNTAFFNNYLKDKQSPIGAVIVHDLSNSVTAMLGFIQLYKEGEDVGLEALLEIKNSYPTFSLIVQDVLLKYLESDQNFTDDPRPMNIALFKQAVNRGLNDKSAAQGRLAKLLTGQLNSSSQYKKFFNMDIPLADGEEIVCEPAVVFNGINNVVNNSIKLQVDANAINVDVRREGDELVIDVIDDGVGMNQDQLDPSGEKYIFGKGVKSSSTGSTGIGLAEFPKRLDRYARGKVFVWSHKREDPDSEVAIFPENTENIPVVKNLTVNNQSVPASTVFEIRLPISKH